MLLPFVCQSGQEQQLKERAQLMWLPKNVLTEGEGRGRFMFHVKSTKAVGFSLSVFSITCHLKVWLLLCSVFPQGSQLGLPNSHRQGCAHRSQYPALIGL